MKPKPEVMPEIVSAEFVTPRRKVVFRDAQSFSLSHRVEGSDFEAQNGRLVARLVGLTPMVAVETSDSTACRACRHQRSGLLRLVVVSRGRRFRVELSRAVVTGRASPGKKKSGRVVFAGLSLDGVIDPLSVTPVR